MSIKQKFDTFRAASGAARDVAVNRNKVVSIFRTGPKWAISYDKDIDECDEAMDAYYEALYPNPPEESSQDVPVDDYMIPDQEEERLYRYDDETELRYKEQMEDAGAYTKAEEEGWYYDD